MEASELKILMLVKYCTDEYNTQKHSMKLMYFANFAYIYVSMRAKCGSTKHHECKIEYVTSPSSFVRKTS